MKKIISAIYVIGCLLCTVCTPLSAIFIICKLCAATSLSWIACCIPLLIALAVLPLLIITKAIIKRAKNRRKKCRNKTKITTFRERLQ